MNGARPAPLPFKPTETRLREIEDRARRIAELDARERTLLTTWARMGSAEVHSPHYGLVAWSFGPGGLTVSKDSTPQGDHI
jgi:hypothetical protein